MAKYTFKCDECGSLEKKFTDVSTKQIECHVCKNLMNRQMPILKGVKTTEVVDKYTNKKHVEDHKKIVEERKHDFYWSKEVPKMVNSGIYELSTMLEKGWVYYDDKGNLVTRTKPPQKE